jgi:type IV pilus assembly protein PilB
MDKAAKIGDSLVKAGLVDQMQLRSALGHQKRWGGKIGKILVDMGFIDEDTMLKFLSEHFRMKAVNLLRSRIAEKTFEVLPEKVAKKYSVVPVVVRGKGNKRVIVLAMSQPADIAAIDEIQFVTGAKVDPVLATDSAIHKVIEHYGNFTPDMGREYKGQEGGGQSKERLVAKPRKAAKKPGPPKVPKPSPQKSPPPRKPAAPPPPSNVGQEPDDDVDLVEISPDDDIEIIKGEVTMLKATKPKPDKRAERPTSASMRSPEMPARGKDVLFPEAETVEEEISPESAEPEEPSPFLIPPGGDLDTPEDPNADVPTDDSIPHPAEAESNSISAPPIFDEQNTPKEEKEQIEELAPIDEVSSIEDFVPPQQPEPVEEVSETDGPEPEPIPPSIDDDMPGVPDVEEEPGKEPEAPADVLFEAPPIFDEEPQGTGAPPIMDEEEKPSEIEEQLPPVFEEPGISSPPFEEPPPPKPEPTDAGDLPEIEDDPSDLELGMFVPEAEPQAPVDEDIKPIDFTEEDEPEDIQLADVHEFLPMAETPASEHSP